MVTSQRACAWAIGVLLACELVLMPFTGHLYDSTVFLALTDFVFFGHTPLRGNWSFGSISLLLLLLSQVPVLVAPSLATLPTVRLFLLKLPSWIADLATAAIVRWSSSDPSSANFWALRYLLDPIVLFTTVFHGQWDALPNVFVVAGIALMTVERYELAAIAFGLGTGTKFYPAAFVPLLVAVAFKKRSLGVAARSLGVFAVTAAATLAPVFWGRLDYVVHAYSFNSFGSGQ